jgi:AcrR family transcriptional regulator
VAAELGVATMSIYRHVRGKDELLMAMIDMAIGEHRLPEVPPVGWRARLELSSRLQWDGFRRHPRLAPAISISRPQPTPNGMAHTEWALRALEGLGLDQPTMLYAHLTIFNFVRGTAVHMEAEAEAERDTGLNADEWMESQAKVYNTIVDTGGFPMLSGFAAQENFELDLDLLFELGLRVVLDGIGGLIERTAR